MNAPFALEMLPGRPEFIRDFPVLGRTVNGRTIAYLDNAATSLTPRPVTDAVARYGLEVCGSVHRGQHQLSEQATEVYEEARCEVARFLGCAADEIVFVRNATEGLNAVAHGFSWAPGDEVVVGGESHHSNDLPWRRATKTLVVSLDAGGLWDLDHYADLLKRRPRLVALTHVSNVTGIYQDLSRLVAMGKQAGAMMLIDAAQSLPHRRLNVCALDADFLVFSAHKLLGPAGIGVLFARRELLRSMTPLCVGGGTVEWVDQAGFRLRSDSRKFEAGTPNVGGALGLTAALNYLDRLGWSRISAHDREMREFLYREARKRASYLDVIYPETTAERAGVISFRFCKNVRVDDIARILSDSFGVMCRSGHLCAQPMVDRFATSGVLRASAYIYNTQDDVQRLFEALDEIADRLSGANASRSASSVSESESQ